MKIMLFSHVCGSQMITGAEKYLLLLARELGRHGDCTLVVPEAGLLSREANAAGIRTVIQTVPLIWQMFRPVSSLGQDVEARLERGEHEGIINLLHMHQPDLVVVNTCLNALPAAAAHELGLPVAWFITEKITENAWSRQAVELLNRYADWIIGISETTLRPIRAHSPAAGAKTYLLPPSWLLEELRQDEWPRYRELRRLELGIREQERLIGFIASSLHEEKGLEHFVTMALQVAMWRPKSRFLIVGKVTDEAYFARCTEMIKASGRGARFHWRGFEPRIHTLYPALDIVVVPSLIDEGFGLTAAEGLLFGASVVAYRSGGLEEIMTTVGNGSGLVDKGDAAGLADRVIALLDTGAAGLEESGEANRASIEAAYGIQAYRRRLQPLLHRFRHRIRQRHAEQLYSPGPRLEPGRLYKGRRSTAVFLLEAGGKRLFATGETMRFYRYTWREVKVVPDKLLYALPNGPVIRHRPPSADNRPSTLLAKGSGPGVFLLAHGRRQLFTSQLALRQRGYRPERVVELPDEELERLPLGEPLQALPNQKEAGKPGKSRGKRRASTRRPAGGKHQAKQGRPDKSKRRTAGSAARGKTGRRVAEPRP
ncbi:glycosyltransferase family 4 protein [Paenibacillus puerhi]|uniref:glycosyltransferase family 4 protein n=1 Tax=Paenibacillus puerhi TaxID=2692622 RepID=UPI0013576E00|nr:glycosyltransferase family 4 protein [Paenibacillus puerhi]